MRKLFLLAIVTTSIGLLAGCGSRGGESARSAQDASTPQLSLQGSSSEENLSTSSQTTYIGEDRAAAIALQDAGIAEEDTAYLRVHLDRDDGFVYYDVDFASQGMEYDYEVQASDGAILKAEREHGDESSVYQNTEKQNGAVLSFEEAKKLVLDRVPGSSDNNMEMELERDDGVLKYEGELYYSGMEYEFEINAENGEFIKWQEEWHD